MSKSVYLAIFVMMVSFAARSQETSECELYNHYLQCKPAVEKKVKLVEQAMAYYHYGNKQRTEILQVAATMATSLVRELELQWRIAFRELEYANAAVAPLEAELKQIENWEGSPELAEVFAEMRKPAIAEMRNRWEAYDRQFNQIRQAVGFYREQLQRLHSLLHRINTIRKVK
jgi:glutamate synthase domain-containing protein 2